MHLRPVEVYKKLRVNTLSKLGVFLGTCPVGFRQFESRDALDVSSLPIFWVATTFPTLFNHLTLQKHLELQQLGISRKTTPNRLRKKHIPMTDPWDERYIYLHFHGFRVVWWNHVGKNIRILGSPWIRHQQATEVGPLDLVVSPSDLKDHGVQQWCACAVLVCVFWNTHCFVFVWGEGGGGLGHPYDISIFSFHGALGRKTLFSKK